jgi:hypothetical protein
MAEYVPPDCEEPGSRRHFATVHVHVDPAKFPKQPATVFLCDSHLRKRVAMLEAARITFEQHRI